MKIIKKNIEEIYKLFENLKQFEPIIICKDVIVFVIFKLNDEEFFLVDSHIPIHGKISKNKIINYITFEGNFNGIISIGCYKSIGINN